MPYFPQLLSGSLAQYPLFKRRDCRTAVNLTAEGASYKLGDPNAARLAWRLHFEGLNAQEWRALEDFYGEMEGALREFTFLDPADNLLCWSGDLSRDSWEKGPLLSLTPGGLGPEGAAPVWQVLNMGSAPQSVQQLLPVPGWFHYCFSVYARSEGSGSAVVYRTTGGTEHAQTFETGPVWRRLILSGRSESAEERVRFGVRLEAGARLELCGFQAEAQPGPSTFRQTWERGGVYPSARFDMEGLKVTAWGPDCYSCRVQICAGDLG